MDIGARVASVDIGSNSIIQLVAERTPDGWRTVDDRVEVARISEGLDASGELAEPAIARAEAVLAGYREVALGLGVQSTVATGTAPFRRSRNGAEVAARLGAVLGTPIDVVSGAHEARLSLLATQRAFPTLGRMLVIDVGGASTELIWAAPDREPSAVSLDVGSVRLTERCDTAGPIGAAQRAALDAEIAKALAEATKPSDAGSFTAVGIAGTVTTLTTAALEMDTYDAAVVHGYELTLAAVEAVFERLAPMDALARAAVPGVPAKRADVLPAGARLVAGVLRWAGADATRVSDRGTRWGRLHERFDGATPRDEAAL